MSLPPTIVCAVDGSPESGHLARIGARLAEALGANLECVHVLGAVPATAPAGAAPVCPHSDEDDEETAARGMLDGICDAAGATSAVRRVVRHGAPPRRIATIAEQRDALLILVGTRADSDAPDAVLGSVAARLPADAPCPGL